MTALIETLPALGAVLILGSGLLALLGFAFIRRHNVPRHKLCMLGAATLAALFLIVYLTRWALAATTPFRGQGAVRLLYLAILGSHSVLAITLVPLVLLALFRALRSDFARHKRIARVALPIWLYVAGTGWVVYWLLHHY